MSQLSAVFFHFNKFKIAVNVNNVPLTHTAPVGQYHILGLAKFKNTRYIFN